MLWPALLFVVGSDDGLRLDLGGFGNPSIRIDAWGTRICGALGCQLWEWLVVAGGWIGAALAEDFG
jgi:hypothetical protein